MRHFKDPRFRQCYEALPIDVRESADRAFALLKRNPRHPSVRFKPIRDHLWSARLGLRHRALALRCDDGYQWFWIGTHADYDRLIG